MPDLGSIPPETALRVAAVLFALAVLVGYFIRRDLNELRRNPPLDRALAAPDRVEYIWLKDELSPMIFIRFKDNSGCYVPGLIGVQAVRKFDELKSKLSNTGIHFFEHSFP